VSKYFFIEPHWIDNEFHLIAELEIKDFPNSIKFPTDKKVKKIAKRALDDLENVIWEIAGDEFLTAFVSALPVCRIRIPRDMMGQLLISPTSPFRQQTTILHSIILM